jgi:hypothetical protein
MDAVFPHVALNQEHGSSALAGRLPSGVDYLVSVLPLSLTLPLLILAALALIVTLLRPRKPFVLLWVALLSSYAYLVIDNYRQVRYTIPLLPFLALLAAYAVTRWGGVKVAKFVGAGVFVAVVGYAFVFSLAYVQVMAQEDPRVQASQWVQANIPRDVPVVIADTGPSDSPQLELLGYTKVPAGQSVDAIRASESPYLIVSEFATREFVENPGNESDRVQLVELLKTDYVELVHFENSQAIGWIGTKTALRITHDWLHPNPRITILKRVPV